MKYRWVCILLIFWLAGTGSVLGKDMSECWSVFLELGNWQPHSLNDEPRFSSFGAAGATPYVSFGGYIPIFSELGLKISIGYWSVRELDEIESVHSLVLHPVHFDLKHWLVPDSRLAAYVIYGGCMYWGVENESDPFGERLQKARLGWGVNLGAGFDLALFRNFGIGMTFHYHLSRFSHPLGGVDDFSGPKIGIESHFFF